MREMSLVRNVPGNFWLVGNVQNSSKQLQIEASIDFSIDVLCVMGMD